MFVVLCITVGIESVGKDVSLVIAVAKERKRNLYVATVPNGLGSHIQRIAFAKSDNNVYSYITSHTLGLVESCRNFGYEVRTFLISRII